MSNTGLFITSAALGAVSAYALRQRRKAGELPLPPGPKADPIIGHFRYIPTSNEEVVYKDWSNELASPIIALEALGQVIIVLNSIDVANELLVKRSAIYSDRPQVPMLTSPNLTGWGKGSGILNYGERWRSQRRMKHEVLHKKASEIFWPFMERHTRVAVQRILDNRNNVEEEVHRMTGATILSSAYGYDVSSTDDQMLKILKNGMKGFGQAAVPTSFLVNIIPWLEYVPAWFPGAGWKQTVDIWRKEQEDMNNIPFNWTKEQMATGEAQPSVLNTLLTRLASQGPTSYSVEEDEDRIKWATGSLYGAASDTTASTALVFMVAMMRHPEIQARAQIELDEVIGDQRLPEMGDRDQLPYINRIIKEVLRWRPVGPLGVAHATSQDDTYLGYRIPKGAIIMANIWAICNDPKVYTDPDCFNPDRFLDPDVPEAPAFGFGRRSCPGLHFAESAVFITITTMLAVFDIKPPKDDKGNDVIPDGRMMPSGLIRFPLEFNCTIKPRSVAREKLLS
ncbi:O-methylsterigmatocystin oxidoreductase [Ceratobasidium theobromae]|uniref:O-methylsterigmatocystin oxidoreductase n=1 Tax=Ceratobasidium theobromae TaxID=1582974 RepID=A0A5N5QGE6_9AGAM|nr:O-methylsterigmatocystin oxidoreductase [Ceratobasidium theobromae]